MVTDPITESEIKLAKQGAMSAHRSARGLVRADDLIQEANLWMVAHMDKVTQWREEGRHGQNKLRHACKQWCLKIVARERRRVSGLQPGDLHYYTSAMISELLPAIWNPDDWQTSSMLDTSELKGPSRPSEGNNRIAMIVDVRTAFYALPKDDQYVLFMLYKDAGMSYDMLGEILGVHERTVRRREERALERMVERLGGEPPWKR